jgi:hypothetical protein
MGMRGIVPTTIRLNPPTTPTPTPRNTIRQNSKELLAEEPQTTPPMGNLRMEAPADHVVLTTVPDLHPADPEDRGALTAFRAVTVPTADPTPATATMMISTTLMSWMLKSWKTGGMVVSGVPR